MPCEEANPLKSCTLCLGALQKQNGYVAEHKHLVHQPYIDLSNKCACTSRHVSCCHFQPSSPIALFYFHKIHVFWINGGDTYYSFNGVHKVLKTYSHNRVTLHNLKILHNSAETFFLYSIILAPWHYIHPFVDNLEYFKKSKLNKHFI